MDWPIFGNTIQTPRASRSRRAQTLEITFKCVFAWINIHTRTLHFIHSPGTSAFFLFIYFFIRAGFPEIQTSVSLSRSDMHDLRQLSPQFEEKVWLIPPLSTSHEKETYYSNIRRWNSFCILHSACFLTQTTAEKTSPLSLSLCPSLSCCLKRRYARSDGDTFHHHLPSLSKKHRRGRMPWGRYCKHRSLSLPLPPTQ